MDNQNVYNNVLHIYIMTFPYNFYAGKIYNIKFAILTIFMCIIQSMYTWMRTQSLGCVWLFVTPWIRAHQIPLSMGFPRHEYWSGLPFPSPVEIQGIFLSRGLNPHLLHWQADSSPLRYLGSPTIQEVVVSKSHCVTIATIHFQKSFQLAKLKLDTH